MVGLAILVRRRRAGVGAGFIDSAIVTVGLSLPQWVWLMAPYLHDHSLSTVGRLVSIAYPMGDVLLLAVTARLFLDGGRRQPAFHLVGLSIVALLVTDFVYGLMTLHGTYDHQLWLDAGWIAFYLLWGAAALHPTMRDLELRTNGVQQVLTRFRLGLLTCASLIAPVIGLADDIGNHDIDMAVVRIGSILLFVLVVLRMAGLMRQQERSLDRERILTRAGAELVAATTREEIDRVAVTAGAELAAPAGAATLYDADGRVLTTTLADDSGVPRGAHATVLDVATRRAEPSALVVAAEHELAEAVRASLN